MKKQIPLADCKMKIAYLNKINKKRFSKENCLNLSYYVRFVLNRSDYFCDVVLIKFSNCDCELHV